MSEDRDAGHGATAGSTTRRSFLQAVGAVAAGAGALLAPLLAGAATLLDPLRRGPREVRSVRLTTLTALPDTGRPMRITVLSERTDAWTHYEAAPVGAVFLSRAGERVRALSVVCPHAGCSVNLAPPGTHFACPCHRSRFALDGRREEGPAPRDMDELDVEVRDGDVWVRFENFQPGTDERIPV